MFILYSFYDNEYKRPFYALKKNGTNYFVDGPKKEYEIIPIDEESNDYLYDSKIIFFNQEVNNKQYLLRVNKYNNAELYEIGENDNINIYLKHNFFDIDNSIYCTYFYLIKIPDENKFFFIFSEENIIKIIKFEFNSPNLNDINKFTIQAASDNYNYGSINSFLIEEEKLLVLFYTKTSDGNRKFSKIYYNYNNLNLINKEVVLDENIGDLKLLHLKNKYFAFICYSSSDYEVKLQISILKYDNDRKYYFENLKEKCFKGEDRFKFLMESYYQNQFIKINDNRLAFLTEEWDLTFNSHDEDVYLLIILINLRGEDYQEVGYKIYHFNSWIEGVSAYAYNNFLVTSITLWYRDFDNDDDYSFLFFFGYPNGTDHSINIFPYLNNLSYIGNTNEDNIYIYI